MTLLLLIIIDSVVNLTILWYEKFFPIHSVFLSNSVRYIPVVLMSAIFLYRKVFTIHSTFLSTHIYIYVVIYAGQNDIAFSPVNLHITHRDIIQFILLIVVDVESFISF